MDQMAIVPETPKQAYEIQSEMQIFLEKGGKNSEASKGA